jgi:excisionase family DNA binding protein
MEEISVKKLLLQIRDLLQSNKSILTIDEASLYLGIKKAQLYKMTSARSIPHFKLPGGKKLFFSKKALQEFVTSHPVKTRNEIRQQISDRLLLQSNRKKVKR